MKPSITWYTYSAVRIDVAGIRIYVDPYRLPAGQPPADVLLVTHEHEHHLSPNDIQRIRRSTTITITSRLAGERIPSPVHTLLPGEELTIGALRVRAVPTYTTITPTTSEAQTQPPTTQGIGFLLDVADCSFYIPGDSGVIPEMDEIGPIDYAILPIGGGAVMTAREAADVAQRVRPSIVIPVHYDGGMADEALRFADLVPDQVRVWILSPTPH